MAAEGGEIDRDLQAVAIRGDVLLAQLRHPHERLRVAHDALHHVVDDLLHAIDLERLAQPHVGDELVEKVAGMCDDLARARRLLLDGGGVDVGLDLDARGKELGARLVLLRRLRLVDRHRGRQRRALFPASAEEAA